MQEARQQEQRAWAQAAAVAQQVSEQEQVRQAWERELLEQQVWLPARREAQQASEQERQVLLV